MNALREYLDTVVEPTFEDFNGNPRSMRHAYLACVATYHAIDHVAYPKNPGNLRKTWRKKSREFTMVDMFAHHFKHVISDDEKQPPQAGYIPLSSLVFGSGTLNTYGCGTHAPGEGGIDLHNLHFVIRDALKFLNEQASVLR